MHKMSSFTRLVTLPYYRMYCTVQQYKYPSVSKVHAGSFRVSVIRLTLPWTTGSLTCVRAHSYACVYTRGVWGTPTAIQHNIFWLGKTLTNCAPDGVRTSGQLNLQSDALPIEPPRHPQIQAVLYYRVGQK